MIEICKHCGGSFESSIEFGTEFRSAFEDLKNKIDWINLDDATVRRDIKTIIKGIDKIKGA